MIGVNSKGSFEQTRSFFSKLLGIHAGDNYDYYGRLGVDALSRATPTDTGRTSASWTYEIEKSGKTVTISWLNTNVNDGAVIALLLQYGHGTGTGAYIQGYDYINPAIRPVFDKIATDIWKKVSNG